MRLTESIFAVILLAALCSGSVSCDSEDEPSDQPEDVGDSGTDGHIDDVRVDSSPDDGVDDGESADADADTDTGEGAVRTLLVDEPLLDPWQLSAGRVDGRPALVWNISDWENEDYRLFFLLSNDIEGTDWPDQSASVELPTGGESFHSPTLMTLADGTPVVFIALGWGHLAYLKAQDRFGSSWDAPVIIDDHNGASDISATLLNDVPVVAYNAGDYLLFVRAQNATGEGWNEPVTAATAVGEWGRITTCRLAIINGYPAMAYQHTEDIEHHTDVYFVRANDTSGDTWLEPILIDDTGGRGDDLDLAQVGDTPVLIYESEASLAYVTWSEDGNGATWETPTAFSQFEGWKWRLVIAEGSADETVHTFFSHYSWGNDDDTEDIRYISVVSDTLPAGSLRVIGVDFGNDELTVAQMVGEIDLQAPGQTLTEIDEQFCGALEPIAE